jgi:hypothetical protein
VLTCVTTNRTRTFQTGLCDIAYPSPAAAVLRIPARRRRRGPGAPSKAALDYIYLELQNGRTPVLDEWDWRETDPPTLEAWLPHYPATVAAIVRRFALDTGEHPVDGPPSK